jgi:hypothetical protein
MGTGLRDWAKRLGCDGEVDDVGLAGEIGMGEGRNVITGMRMGIGMGVVEEGIAGIGRVRDRGDISGRVFGRMNGGREMGESDEMGAEKQQQDGVEVEIKDINGHARDAGEEVVKKVK